MVWQDEVLTSNRNVCFCAGKMLAQAFPSGLCIKQEWVQEIYGQNVAPGPGCHGLGTHSCGAQPVSALLQELETAGLSHEVVCLVFFCLVIKLLSSVKKE